MHPAIQRLERHRRRYQPTGATWWLTVSEATHLAGWTRQETHRLVTAGVIERRTYRTARRRRLVRINGADVLAILRSRHE